MDGLHAAFARLHEAIDEISKILSHKDLRPIDRSGNSETMGAERHANLKIDVSAPTLAVLLDEYEAARRTSDISDVHLSNHMTGVRECVKDCGWVFPSQVTAPAVVGHLERRKALGNGPRRRNHVRAYILHFADMQAAGVPRRTGEGAGLWHSFRKMNVTERLIAGAGLEDVRRLARHVDSRTTMDHYARKAATELKKSAEILPRLNGFL